MKNILLVEDQNSEALDIRNFLKELGFTNIFIANNVAEASDFILTIRPKIPFIYLSSEEDDETLQKAIQTNPAAIIKKALYLTELEEAVRKVFN